MERTARRRYHSTKERLPNGVVEVDCLAALDCLQWLRTGSRAAEILGCSQSGISRSARKCERIFGISLKKQAAEWRLKGDDTLIQAERRVHQQHRWSSGASLRLETQHWQRDTYGSLPLAGWIKGNMNYLEYQQPQALIQERIIDAWLCSAPDAPTDTELATIPLCSMPSLLTVKHDHPLAALGDAITLEDVRAYPLLPLPKGAFPVFESMLEAQGLTLLRTAESARPGEAIEDLLVGIASPLTLDLYGPETIALPIRLPMTVGDVLVVKREYADHPRTRALATELLSHLRRLAETRPNLVVHDQSPVVNHNA